MKLSIVSTLYKSDEFLEEFYNRIVAEASELTKASELVEDFEIIFVDDGSPDNSAKHCKELIQSDDRLRLIELSRNFGHHHAILAGLENVNGELIFLIDSDLEEKPECLGLFWEKLQQENADVVFGVQKAERKGSFFERLSGEIFYSVFNTLSDTEIPKNICTARLMKRHYVEELLLMGDANLFLGGQFAWLGFNQIEYPIEKSQVRKKSSYSAYQKFVLSVNALTSYSSYPIRMIFWIGLGLFILSSSFLAYRIIYKLLNPEAVLAGWSSVMVSIWFLGSLNILFLGLIGIYISKIFIEVKGRQKYIIRNIHKRKTQRTELPKQISGS